MYGHEVDRLADAFRWEPATQLVRTVDFVLASIQQQFHTVPSILTGWSDWYEHNNTCENGEELDKPGTLWGMKADGFWYVRRHKNRLSACLKYELSKHDRHGAMDTFMEIPGLNTVKAGFAAQLIGFRTACMDLHNADLYGIDVRSYHVPTTSTARLRLAKIASYITLCDEMGGSEDIWNEWCHLVAIKYPRHYADADQVSKQHMVISPMHRQYDVRFRDAKNA